MAASRPLYSVIAENNAEQAFLHRQSRRKLTEDVTTDEESDLISDLRSKETQSFHEGGSRYFNILASGKIFRLITKATGLWNPRKKHYALLCTFFVVLNFLALLAEILIPYICGPFVGRCVTHSKHVTNSTKGTNNDSQTEATLTKIYDITLAFDAWNALSDTLTYILLIYTLWRVQQQLPSLSLEAAQAKVTSREWLSINVIFIICSLAITVVVAFKISVAEHNQMELFGTYGFGVLIVYLTAFTCCCVFAVLTCALGSLTDVCFRELCNVSEGSLNDVTALHQKLCKQLSTASQSLKLWFVVHWVVFGIYCFAVFIFESMYFGLISRKFSNADNIFVVIAFVLNFTIFLIPCVYASRVSWKCDDMLYKLNNMSSADWSDGHPFRERVNVNEFIFYAERSKCGFRIGKVTFGSNGTWISVCIGLLGLGVRVFAFVN